MYVSYSGVIGDPALYVVVRLGSAFWDGWVAGRLYCFSRTHFSGSTVYGRRECLPMY